MSEIFTVQFRTSVDHEKEEHCTILGVYTSLDVAKTKAIEFFKNNRDLNILVQISKSMIDVTSQGEYEMWIVEDTIYKKSSFQGDCFIF